MAKNIYDLLDEVRSIAQNGLNYSKEPYDRQRYERLMEIVSSTYGDITGITSDEIKSRFARELGYITPKVGIQGAVVNDKGEILLEKRADDGKWGVPAGWMEVGETPAQCIQREILEETNLQVIPEKIIGIYNRLAGAYQQPHASVHLLFWCRLVGGELKKSFESLELKYQDPLLVTEWHANHREIALDAVKHWQQLKR